VLTFRVHVDAPPEVVHAILSGLVAASIEREAIYAAAGIKGFAIRRSGDYYVYEPVIDPGEG
jgi:hypothetical protein